MFDSTLSTKLQIGFECSVSDAVVLPYTVSIDVLL